MREHLDDWAAARGDGALPDAVFEHLAACPACAERFEQALREDAALTQAHDEFRRGHVELREQLMQSLPKSLSPPARLTLLARGWRWIGGTATGRRVACGAALLSTCALAAIITIFDVGPQPDLLAQTAEALRSAEVVHFRMRMPDRDAPRVREGWTKGNRTYLRVLHKGDLEMEAWVDPQRYLTYHTDTDHVTIQRPPPSLLAALKQVHVIRRFDPELWEPCPPDQVAGGRLILPAARGRRRAARRGLPVQQEPLRCRVATRHRVLRVFRMRRQDKSPGHSAMLWIDEETHLPASCEGLNKASDQEAWQAFSRVEFIWDQEKVTDDIFVPKYPDTASVGDRLTVTPEKRLRTEVKE